MQTAAGGAGLLAGVTAHGRVPSANEKVRIAIVGVGGMGGSHVGDKNVKAEQVVALCDIDDHMLDNAAKTHPKAQKFNDFRKLFDQIGKDIDAVICATPDHTHAVVAARALREGKHVYCQKPLTHTVYEAHVLGDLAKKNPKLITQMGNQGHSNNGARDVVEIVRAGTIGPIKEVHAWTDRPIWPQGIDRPRDSSPIPKHVHWDLWLGPMPARPYHEGTYHTFKWRGWWDFGTGALGDMACHVVDTAFWALDLQHPTSIESTCEGIKPETGPKWSNIVYEFPARGDLPPVKFTWYDGGKFPPIEIAEKYGITVERETKTSDGKKEKKRVPGYTSNGSLLIGEKGVIYLDDAYGATYKLLPAKQFEGFKPPPQTIARVPGGHMKDWIDGIKEGRQACSNFDYATALTGMVLLGNLSLRTGKKIEWDAKQMRATNSSEADELINPPYRKGWEL
jgi:predicted dehydrogenase